METNTAKQAQTYAEAQKQLQNNKRKNISDIVRWDAGEGYKGEGFWCASRKRIVTYVISPSGHQIV